MDPIKEAAIAEDDGRTEAKRELSHCPFCSCTGADVYTVRMSRRWMVYCDGCCAQGPSSPVESQAVTWWNERPWAPPSIAAAPDFHQGAIAFVEYEKAIAAGNDAAAMAHYNTASKFLRAAIIKAIA